MLEILAPAGSAESLTAAVRAGADAVYLGAASFNARQSAKNFSDDELAAAVAYCHARGVRVHLTLNTLVREDEMAAALSVAKTACEIGVDALIVQDRGLARRIRAMAPDLPLHASTQLSCHTPAGVIALRDAGFTRVVLAREMSREEIAACGGLGCETEMFVHGALCMSVSGQCYLSAELGGRSGNRGRCAGPCRLPFCASDGGKSPAEDYAMSLCDLSLARQFGELEGLGVCSLKIEGRMKRPEYVAAATACYAALRDGRPLSEEDLSRLQAVFSRSGFTDGYFTARRGSAMFGHRRHEDVTAADGVLKDLRRLYDRETPRVPVTAALTAHPGDPLTLTLSDGARAVTVTGDPAAAARPALPDERVTEQLKKTGGTPFFVTSVTAAGEGGYPVAALNALRREGLSRLETERSRPRPVPVFNKIPDPVEKRPSPLWSEGTPRLLVRLAREEQLTDEVKAAAAGWFLPLSRWKGAEPCGVEIPRGMFGTEEAVRRELAAFAAAGGRFALCGNVGAVPLAVEAGLIPVGGFGLNLMNREAVAAYAAEGLLAATLSPELAFSQMGFAADCPIPTGVIVYGRMPLMLTRNCPRRCDRGDDCRGCTPESGATDRRGVTFPTACEGGCTEVLNSVPLYWGDKLEQVPKTDFRLLHFTTEDPALVARVTESYRTGGPFPGEITRGLYRKGVE